MLSGAAGKRIRFAEIGMKSSKIETGLGDSGKSRGDADFFIKTA
jgi:hypothetical protein